MVSAERFQLLEEADRRGILSPEKSALFAEAKSRGIIGQTATKEAPEESYLDSFLAAPRRLAGGVLSGLQDTGFGAVQTGSELVGNENMAGAVSDVMAKKQAKEAAHPEISESLPYKAGKFGARIATGLGGGLVTGAARIAATDPHSEGEGGLINRAKDTAIDVVTGKVVGKAINKAVEAAPIIQKGFEKVKNFATRVKNGGTDEEIMENFVTPEQAKQQAQKLIRAEKEGRQTGYVDIAGDEVAGLTRLLAKTSGSKNIINDYMNTRSATSSRRVRNAINSGISSKEYFGNADDIIKARAELSSPLYKKAAEEFPEIPTLYKTTPGSTSTARSVEGTPVKGNITTEVENISRNEKSPLPDYRTGVTDQSARKIKVGSEISERSDPYSLVKETRGTYGDKMIKPVMEGDKTIVTSKPELQKVARDTSGYLDKNLAPKEKQIAVKFQPLVEDPRIQGAYKKAQQDYGIGEAPITSFTALDGIKKALDDVSGEAKRLGAGEKAREFTSLKQKLVKFMDDLSPTYKEARGTFAGKSELLESQEKGLNFDKEFLSAAEIKKYNKDLTAGEKDTFKVGVAQNLLNTVAKTADESSAARKIFGNDDIRSKLKVIFDTPKEYADFAKKMGDEIRIFKTKQRILGGSRTDINLADEASVIDKIARGTSNPKGAVVNAVIDSIKKRYIGLNDRNARQLAETFADRQKSIDMLMKIAKKADTQQKEIINQIIIDYTPAMVAAQLSAGEAVKPLMK